MRNLHDLDKYRQTGPDIIARFGSPGDESCGVFQITSQYDFHVTLLCIASSGEGWDHVSVSARHEKPGKGKGRIPLWLEMAQVKRMFFRADETVMQLHVPAADHINCCKYSLHLWKPIGREIPRPPAIMVGPINPEIGEPT